MGMTAVCPKDGCDYNERSNSHRGGRLGTCPRDGTQLRAHTAGRAKGRYICAATGSIVTLGITGVQISEPMRITIENPDDTQRSLGPWERRWFGRAEGLVFGPGCVVDRELDPARPNPYRWMRATLEPAPDADPATWVVNEPLQYKKCAGCNSRVAVTGRSLMTEPWSPARAYYWTGRNNRSRRTVDTNPGPHPAGTVSCADCRPGGKKEED